MRNPWVAVLAVYLTLLDVVFTLRYWHIEDNPLVLAIGPVPFVLLKVSLVLALVAVWVLLWDTRGEGVGEMVMWIYVYLMAVVAIVNIIHVLDIPF